MDTRTLGNSDLAITRIGFGAWGIGGGGWQFGWGPQDDKDSVAAIREAVDAGINWIDTAAVYGLGHSEEVVGRALEGLPRRPLVFTKCGMVWGEDRQIGRSLRADSVRRECAASLRRLKVDVIDLYQVHWPNPDEDLEEGWTALARLRDEGKVRWLGASNFSVAQLRRVRKIAPVTSLQPPYSLLRRDIETEVLPFCQREKVGVIAYSPMGSGMLTGAMTRERIARLPGDDWRRNMPDFQEPLLTRNLELVERLREIGRRLGRTPAEVAVAWVLRHPAVTGAIVGARRPGQVAGFKGAADFSLDDGDAARLEVLAARPTK